MAEFETILNTAKLLPERLQALAGRLELGQAVAPLSEAAAALNEFPRTGHELTLVLIGVTPEARAMVLSWLLGPQHQSVSVKLSEPLELLEIRLQERGYSLESTLAERSEFGSPEEFLSALTQHAENFAFSGDLLEPIRLGLHAPPPLRNLTLLAPAHIGVVAAAPRILSTIASRTALLLIAAPAGYPWTSEELGAIGMIAENVLAVWPVHCGEKDEGKTVLEELTQRLSCPALPLVQLEHAQAAFIPDFIVQGPAHPLRQAITLSAYQRRCMSLLDMIGERFETDLRQLESRQKREARLERAAEASAKESDARAGIDRYKIQFNEDLTRLLQALRENGRRALGKSGAIGQLVESMLASLQADDLEREVGHKVIKLSLKPQVLADFRRRIGKALRQQINEDCILIRDSLDLIRQSSEPVLADASATTRSLSLAAPDNRGLWESLSEVVDIEIKYRGELPRRGFWQRLAEGRRMVFVVMMLMSLAGSFLGFNIRQFGVFGVFLLLLFIGGVIYTYTSWHKEETENLDKEIDKVRESLQAEFNRVLNDVMRDKTARLQMLLDDIKKEGIARLDNALKEAMTNKAQSSEAERRDARNKLRVIDQRLKELRPLGQDIAKLLGEIRAFGYDAQAMLRKLVQAEVA